MLRERAFCVETVHRQLRPYNRATLFCLILPQVPFVKILADFFPIILFFATFKYGQAHAEQTAEWLNVLLSAVTPEQAPVLAATLVAIVATIVQVAAKLVRGQKPEATLWLSLAVIVVFGSLTLWLHNAWFIQCKPSILYGIFAGILLFGQLTGRNYIQKLMGGQLSLPASVWSKLQWAWIGFFVCMAVLNLLVAWLFSTEVWVNFKLFGLMSLTFIFTIAVVLWAMQSAKTEHNNGHS